MDTVKTLHNHYGDDSNKSQAVFSQDGRIIGKIRGRTFFKRVRREKHFFNAVQGYGIDREAFLHDIQPQCDTIKIYEKDTGKRFKVSVTDFSEHCIKTIKPFGHYAAQFYLPIAYFVQENNEKPQPELFSAVGGGR